MKTPVVLVTADAGDGDPAGGIAADRHRHARRRCAVAARGASGGQRRAAAAAGKVTGVAADIDARNAAPPRLSMSFDPIKPESRIFRANRFLNHGARKPATIATIGQAGRVTLVEERETGMRFDWRAICGPALTTATALIAFAIDRYFIGVPNPAPLFVCIVAFAGSLSGLASGLISAAHRGRLFRAVLPQPPCGARLRHGRSGAARHAVGDRGRHRRHHRPAAAKNDGCVRVGAQALCHGRAAVGGARPVRHRHRAARFRHPRGIHQPRLPRLFLASRRQGRQQAAVHRADVSRPRHRRLRTAGGRVERLHRAAHRDDTLGRFHADQHPARRTERCCASAARHCPTADGC